MNSKPLTKKQMAVLNFMHLYFRENDQLPSVNAMRCYFGWSSENSGTCFQSALEQKGWIERNAAGKYRFARPKVPA